MGLSLRDSAKLMVRSAEAYGFPQGTALVIEASLSCQPIDVFLVLCYPKDFPAPDLSLSNLPER